jgi:hypothetical protein
MDLLNDKLICIKLLMQNIIDRYNSNEIDIRDYAKTLKVTVVDSAFSKKSYEQRLDHFNAVFTDLPFGMWYEDIVIILISPEEQVNLFN